uniref:Phage integrase n=1 Tax=mine drainage metagenome TaxID=410659 RepID=E6PP45_9ZZZZ
MPRPRNSENRGLPARWKHRHGAYYYSVPPGLEDLWEGKQQFRLGKTLPEAYRIWAERLGSTPEVRSVGQLLDRYALEVVPTKAPQTQESNQLAIKRLRAVFGALPISAIKPQTVYKYVDKRSVKTKSAEGRVTGGRVAAHREVEVLSHSFTKAVQWGYIDRHPFKFEVRLEGESPRTRYIEDWEVIESLSLPSTRKKGSVGMIQAYMRIKLITGLRRGDLLRLTMTDFQEDGIHVQPSKTANTTGKRLIIEWSAELRAAIEMAKATRPVLSPHLFCNRRGESYVDESGHAHGWDSMWQRFMERILSETKVKTKFTEHDLRAKCASDAETLAHARQLLAHADERTTMRVYRRRPERVKPLR